MYVTLKCISVGVIDLFINKHYKFYSTSVWKSKQAVKLLVFSVVDGNLNSEGYIVLYSKYYKLLNNRNSWEKLMVSVPGSLRS